LLKAAAVPKTTASSPLAEMSNAIRCSSRELYKHK
jgi:hypothetical protein